MEYSRLLVILFVYCCVKVSQAWETCDGCSQGCIGCSYGGDCVPTSCGSYYCKCPHDRIGNRCELSLLLPGWFNGGNGYQYYTGTRRQNYWDAKKSCEKYGGRLAVHGVRNPKTIRDNISRFPPNCSFWIDLNDIPVEGTFVWRDDIRSSDIYAKWYPGQPDDSGNQDCVVFQRNQSDIFYRDESCYSEMYYAFCEKPIGYPPRIPFVDGKNNCSYTIITPAKYATSKRLCKYLGGKLAVKALANELFIKNILQTFTETGDLIDLNVFVGFTDVQAEGNFTADDGTPLNTNLVWRFGNPGPNPNTDDCLTLTPNYWAWLDDKNCDLLLPGLCEISSQPEKLNVRKCKSGKVCPESSLCVVNEVTCHEECCCIEGYIKNYHGQCTKNLCKSHIRCGPNAVCAVVNPFTNKQQCVCQEGFFPRPDISTQGCFDPCDNVQCGPNARCVVDPETKREKCICREGFLPNNTAEEGCFYDLCGNRNITCGNNARCCVLCEATKRQGCICLGGFIPAPTAKDGCVEDRCNESIQCGPNAICTVVNDTTDQQGCVCKKGFIPNADITTGGCFDPCNGVICGENAFCVVDPDTRRQKCICREGFLPNNTAEEGCFFDRCGNRNITCGDNARCCVLCEATKRQGCICLGGFIPSPTAKDGCVEDRCNGSIQCGPNAICTVVNDTTDQQGCVCKKGFIPNADITTGGCFDPCNGVMCGENALCVVDPDTRRQKCICREGFLPNNTAEEGCFFDRCGNRNITCGDNARCCIVCVITKRQDCLCLKGFVPAPLVPGSCIADPRCTQNTALDIVIVYRDIDNTAGQTAYMNDVALPITGGITRAFRSGSFFTMYNYLGASNLVSVFNPADVTNRPNTESLEDTSSLLISHLTMLERTFTNNIVLLFGAPSTATMGSNTLSLIGRTPGSYVVIISDQVAADQVPELVARIIKEICDWVDSAYQTQTAVIILT